MYSWFDDQCVPMGDPAPPMLHEYSLLRLSRPLQASVGSGDLPLRRDRLFGGVMASGSVGTRHDAKSWDQRDVSKSAWSVVCGQVGQKRKE